MTDRVIFIDNPIKDWPYAELAEAAIKHRKNGWLINAKFTCSACHKRATGVSMKSVQVCNLCGALHDYEASGGNYKMEKEYRHER